MSNENRLRSRAAACRPMAEKALCRTAPATALGPLADSWEFLLGEPRGGPAESPPRGTA
ncbi:hypothetical protein ABZT34_41630 [Streptomyces sp. NPDC005329]|uniref:hypothetical protein n=1 Tax=Streptomyces sp. NPDC005329 TaxID=3157034 RepID=UPI0033A17C1C